MRVYEEKPHKLSLPQSHDRSVGLHISEVIRDYALNSGALDKKWVTEVAIEEQNTNMMWLGLAAEEALAISHPNIDFHPGEVWIDLDDFCGRCSKDIDECRCKHFEPLRIFMSPDGTSLIDVDDYADLWVYCDYFLHEFKFTKKSSRDFAKSLRTREKKVKMWLWQIMSYCKALNTLAAKLHVMFVNGNYSRKDDDPDSQASYKIFRFEFDQNDIDSNWDLLSKHARAMARRKVV